MDLAALTEKVRELAVETGAFIREERKKFNRTSVEKKHAHDYVSYVDKESERRIVSRLKDLLPEAGFIAEEGSGSLNDETYCWLVDPLDGTTNFIHDNAPYCVSIALRNREEYLIGVVYEICRNECFWTYKGAPSFLNGNEIHVSSVADPDDAFLALGFPYNVYDYKPTAVNWWTAVTDKWLAYACWALQLPRCAMWLPGDSKHVLKPIWALGTSLPALLLYRMQEVRLPTLKGEIRMFPVIRYSPPTGKSMIICWKLLISNKKRPFYSVHTNLFRMFVCLKWITV